MSKVVDWNKTYKPMSDITKGKGSTSKFRSMKESFAQSHELMKAQEAAEETLRKAFPVMKSILLQRMVSKSPLKVMRPLAYTTETLSGDNDDDGFYMNSNAGQNATFKSVTRVLPVGTELTFVTLEKSMNQLWFKTDRGEEVGIYLDEQNRLLTQTDIYEIVSKAMNDEE